MAGRAGSAPEGEVAVEELGVAGTVVDGDVQADAVPGAGLDALGVRGRQDRDVAAPYRGRQPEAAVAGADAPPHHRLARRAGRDVGDEAAALERRRDALA